jgi:hypothetical protein
MCQSKIKIKEERKVSLTFLWSMITTITLKLIPDPHRGKK